VGVGLGLVIYNHDDALGSAGQCSRRRCKKKLQCGAGACGAQMCALIGHIQAET